MFLVKIAMLVLGIEKLLPKTAISRSLVGIFLVKTAISRKNIAMLVFGVATFLLKETNFPLLVGKLM